MSGKPGRGGQPGRSGGARPGTGPKPRRVSILLTQPAAVALTWLVSKRDSETPADVDLLIATLWCVANRQENRRDNRTRVGTER